MVRVVGALLICSAAALRVCYGQGPLPAAPSSAASVSIENLKRDANQRAVEWLSLAGNLESRLARMLPCDARASGLIDEVQAASDARFAAANRYWQAMAARSNQGLPGIDQLAQRQQERATEFAQTQGDTDSEHSSVEAHLVALKMSVAKAPSFGGAGKQLEALAAESQQMAERAGQRTANAAALASDLRAVGTQGGGNRSEIDAKLKALAAEQSGWNEYYGARRARAQTECFIINPAARRTPQPAPVRPKPAGGPGGAQ